MGITCCGGSFWLYVFIIIGLVIFAGLMSGLTLGLMSLSLLDLEVLQKSGSPKDQRHAARILPVVRRQHLLLCTLLLGNALAMEALPIFLDELVPSWGAILISVTLILIAGEILPQAICSRYGLAVGSTLAPFVRVLLLLFYPVAFPISKVLDAVLGKDHDVMFRRPELQAFVSMHSERAGKGGDLSADETTIIAGALQLAGKTVEEAMTPLGETFALSMDARLDKSTMKLIMGKGHSRVPVYAGSKDNIVGMILVKTLLTVKPEDETPVCHVPIRRIPRVPASMPLYDILNKFQEGHSHMAAVTSVGASPVLPPRPLDSIVLEVAGEVRPSPFPGSGGIVLSTGGKGVTEGGGASSAGVTTEGNIGRRRVCADGLQGLRVHWGDEFVSQEITAQQQEQEKGQVEEQVQGQEQDQEKESKEQQQQQQHGASPHLALSLAQEAGAGEASPGEVVRGRPKQGPFSKDARWRSSLRQFLSIHQKSQKEQSIGAIHSDQDMETGTVDAASNMQESPSTSPRRAHPSGAVPVYHGEESWYARGWDLHAGCSMCSACGCRNAPGAHQKLQLQQQQQQNVRHDLNRHVGHTEGPLSSSTASCSTNSSPSSTASTVKRRRSESDVVSHRCTAMANEAEGADEGLPFSPPEEGKGSSALFDTESEGNCTPGDEQGGGEQMEGEIFQCSGGGGQGSSSKQWRISSPGSFVCSEPRMSKEKKKGVSRFSTVLRERHGLVLNAALLERGGALSLQNLPIGHLSGGDAMSEWREGELLGAGVSTSLNNGLHNVQFWEMGLSGDNDERIVGIITMEDVIEELLQEEIYDETDVTS